VHSPNPRESLAETFNAEPSVSSPLIITVP
jgi:hypothetical protein